MLIVDLTYIQPLAQVEKHLADHRQFLSQHYAQGNFLASGPKDPRTGGIIIALVDLEAMNDIIAKDPFYIHQVAEYKITSFDPVRHCPQIAELVKG